MKVNRDQGYKRANKVSKRLDKPYLSLIILFSEGVPLALTITQPLKNKKTNKPPDRYCVSIHRVVWPNAASRRSLTKPLLAPQLIG
jgi:hypothetical protein